MELVQLGFISEVRGVNHHDPADLNTFPPALLIAANQTKQRQFAFPLPMPTPLSTPPKAFLLYFISSFPVCTCRYLPY